MFPSFSASRFPRRILLAGSLAACASSRLLAQPSSDCPRCGGLKRVPIVNAKPFVWRTGDPPPDNGAVGERPCPACQPPNDNADLTAQVREHLEAAQQNHRQWEERTGWKLELVVTRHAAIVTQLSP